MSTFRKGFRISCIYNIRINNSKPIFACTLKFGVVQTVSMVNVNSLNSWPHSASCRSCGFVSISSNGLQTTMDEENITRAQVKKLVCLGSANSNRFYFSSVAFPKTDSSSEG